MSVELLPTEQHRFYVSFELRPEEDRNASIEAGQPVFKDVEYAVITMPGGSLVVDKQITPALLTEWKHGTDRKPASPFAVAAYQAWKEGREAPVNGTALSNWPGVTPAQLKMCLNAEVRTVEDLAQADEDILRRLGMGSRVLKDKARAYLDSAVKNKGSEEIASLKEKLDQLSALVETQAEQIAAFEAERGETKRKPGRPPRE